MEYHYGGGNYNNNNYQNNRKPDNGDFLSWALIAVFFLTGLWPLGLFLLISKLSDGSGKKKRTYSRTGTARPSVSTSYTQQQQQRPQEAPKAQSAVSKVTKTPQYGDKGSRTMSIIGLILAIVGVLAVFGSFAELISGDYNGLFEFLLRGLSYPLAFLTSGVGLLLGARGMKRRERRFAKYLAAAGKKEAIDINYLARVAEVTEPKAEKDMEIMVDKGLWGPEAFVDNSNDMLFRTQAAAAEYFQKKDRPATPVQTEEGYSGILRNIRRANDRISDPALSAKIDRLEMIAGRIFKLIEEDPSRQAKANTFLNYYLPTTQKLLDSYADFEEAGVSGENLSQAKAKIEVTMDKIVAGFERQLDQLYQADAMDVDSDIKVMETMLRRDGGSVEDDFGLGGGTAVQRMEK